MKQRTINVLLAVLAIAALTVALASGGGSGGQIFQPRAMDGDVSNFSGVHIAAPTAIATATPALYVNQAGVSQIGSFQDGGSEVLGIRNGGGVVVSAATAVATAQPAFQVDSAGVSNILEVRDAATPVFTVRNGGVVVGNVLQYGSSGYRVVCNTTEITGTGTLAHGLATPVAVLGNLSEDATGDHAHVSFTNSAATVTAKVWDTALTPAASSAGANVDWCVVGVP